jgi:hypothetical protein
MGTAPRRARWRTPTTGALGLGVIGVIYLALAAVFVVLAGVAWDHDGQLARGSAAVGAVGVVIAASALAQAAACRRLRTGDRAPARRLATAGGWLLGLAAVGLVPLLFLGEAALACVAAGLVVPLPPLFLWLTFGTIQAEAGTDGVH